MFGYKHVNMWYGPFQHVVLDYQLMLCVLSLHLYMKHYLYAALLGRFFHLECEFLPRSECGRQNWSMDVRQ